MEQQLKDAMRARHTVRKYKDQVLPDDIRTSPENRVSELNGKLGLAIRLISSDKDPLNTMGKFFLGGKGVKNFCILDVGTWISCASLYADKLAGFLYSFISISPVVGGFILSDIVCSLR